MKLPTSRNCAAKIAAGTHVLLPLGQYELQCSIFDDGTQDGRISMNGLSGAQFAEAKDAVERAVAILEKKHKRKRARRK